MSAVERNVIHLSPTWSRRLRCVVARTSHAVVERTTAVGARLAARSGRMPSWAWPLTAALATWPSTSWMLGRLLDDAGHPLGLAALAALLLSLWQGRTRFGERPAALAVGVAALLVLAADLSTGSPLVRASLAVVAVAVMLAGIATRDARGAPGAPLASCVGLLLLMLPGLSALREAVGPSLQSCMAEGTRWLLAATGAEVVRFAGMLSIDGQVVVADTSASVLRMAWVACFTACIVARTLRLPSRALVVRLPAVLATVVAGGVVRNAVLAAAAAGGVAMTDAMRAAIDLLTYVAIVGPVVALFTTARRAATTSDAARPAHGAIVTAGSACRPRLAAGS